jgi:hypothetical protein
LTNVKKPLKLRHELKFSINQADDQVVTSRLRKIFQHDEFADADGSYRVNSLYFDTPYDKALRQKIDGVSRREKFRIRYYNEDLNFIRLEKKIKFDKLNAKYNARLTAEEIQKILNGDYQFLLESEDELKIEFYSKLKGQLLEPKTIVTYNREAFKFSPANVRITVDRNLRTTINPYHFLNPSSAQFDVERGFSIFEVKYDEFLPEIVKMAVQIPNRQARENSKYALSRRFD